MYLKKLLLVAVLAFALSACGETQQEDTSAPDGQTTQATGTGEETTPTETTAMETTETTETTEAAVGAGEVTVGGFVIESPGVPAREVPEVATDPEAVNEYLDQVRPVVDGTARDISDLVNPEVQIAEDGTISIDPNLASLEEAQQSVQDGASELQQIDPPADLALINDELVAAYEEAAPAYQNIAEAAQSGDPEQFASATQESLPRIQAFNTEVNAILEDLEQAANQAN